MIRTVAIVLCDNDFHSVFPPMLETIKQIVKYHEGSNPEDDLKYKITEFVKRTYLAYYIAFSHWSTKDLEDLNSTDEYLSKIKVLFDEEAEKHIMEHDHDSGSWYLEIQSGVIKAY